MPGAPGRWQASSAPPQGWVLAKALGPSSVCQGVWGSRRAQQPALIQGHPPSNLPKTSSSLLSQCRNRGAAAGGCIPDHVPRLLLHLERQDVGGLPPPAPTPLLAQGTGLVLSPPGFCCPSARVQERCWLGCGPSRSRQVAGGTQASLPRMAAVPPPALFSAPGEMGLPEGGSSLIQRCLSEGLRRIIPVHRGTSCRPGPANRPGHSHSNSAGPIGAVTRMMVGTSSLSSSAAPGTAACTSRAGGPPWHKTPARQGHQERRHLGEECAGALSIPKPALGIPSLLWAPLQG